MAKKITWTLQQVRVGDLIEWDKNPRILSDRAAAELDESLKRFGYVEPAVVNADGKSLIGGHMRLRRMRQIGMIDDDAMVEVRIPNRQLTASEYEELAIRLNKNTGEWDWDKLESDFNPHKLVDMGFDAADFGLHNETLALRDGMEASEEDVNFKKKNVKDSDSPSVIFEVMMTKKGRAELHKVLNAIKEKQGLQRTDQALEFLASTYKV